MTRKKNHKSENEDLHFLLIFHARNEAMLRILQFAILCQKKQTCILASFIDKKIEDIKKNFENMICSAFTKLESGFPSVEELSQALKNLYQQIRTGTANTLGGNNRLPREDCAVYDYIIQKVNETFTEKNSEELAHKQDLHTRRTITALKKNATIHRGIPESARVRFKK